jgi:Protein of unknown function (DUF1553)/Protein of unknown function (DUF1549)
MTVSRRLIKSALMVGVILLGFGLALGAVRSRTRLRVQSVSLNPAQSLDLQQVIESSNRDLKSWQADAQLQTAEKADNLTIARRLALGLVGCGLSLEEIRALQAVPEAEQIQWLTSYLLQDRRWADYFAERFSRAMVGTDEGPFLLFRRRRFNSWLSDQLHQGVGYDAIVRAVIASDGLWTDTPQVNFITASMSEEDDTRCNPIVLTGRTSRTFLAQRIDCLQCHSDFLDQHNFGSTQAPIAGEQLHFHQLAAFYGTTGTKGNPFGGIRDVGGSYSTQLLGDTEKTVIEPSVPFLSELLPNQGNPRQRLAAWVTHPENRAFARATVNRVWALLFSRPLVGPVDSIPMDDSVPAILDTLADDFAEHQFDLRRLIRVITSTDAFVRSSRAEFEISQEHENRYAVFPITQLRPDQVVARMIQAGRLAAIDNESSVFLRLARFGATNDFLRDFGDRGIDEFQSDAITVAQRLVLMNGNLITDRTKEDLIGNAATRIANLVADDDQTIELIFLTVLGRQPTPTEVEVLTQHICGKSNSARATAVGDIYWAMMNSTEFAWNN